MVFLKGTAPGGSETPQEISQPFAGGCGALERPVVEWSISNNVWILDGLVVNGFWFNTLRECESDIDDFWVWLATMDVPRKPILIQRKSHRNSSCPTTRQVRCIGWPGFGQFAGFLGWISLLDVGRWSMSMAWIPILRSKNLDKGDGLK